ncbi:hypothetical protein evm_009041 [Chilo suppressalis]|nr:hypothetical protein evm_009041 [Chilo suppressalis]
MSLLSAVLQEADKASSEELKKHCDSLLPKMRELHERIQLITFDLQQNFLDLFVHFCPTKSLEQLNYKNRKSNIITDYSKIAEEIENSRRNCGETEEELMKYYEKLNESIKIFNEACTVTEGKKILEKADHESRRYNHIEAIQSIKELQKQLKCLKFDDKLGRGLSTLKAQAQNQLAVYIAQVNVEWEDIFKWTEKKSVYFITYSLSVQQSDPLLIQRVLKTLYTSEIMNAGLGQFSHFFIEKLLHNVIRHNCDIYTEDHLGALEFNIRIDLNDKNKPTYQIIFNNLTAIFEFLETTLGSQFDCDKKFIEVFANTIREKFFNKLIDDCIKYNLPSCESSYENYKAIVAELDCFNKFLIEIRFVEAEKSPLNKYIDDTECVLYEKKCGKLLIQVRSLLSESLLNTKEMVGIAPAEENDSILDVTEKENTWDLNKPLFLPRCQISSSVKKIMDLIVKHLEESLKLPEKYQKLLVLTIKDIAVMYQTLVPAKFKSELESCPWAIGIFFNNCFYLAHGLVGPPWKLILPANLADMLMTVLLECIQDLRVIALEKISLFLEKKRKMITDSILETDDTEEDAWTMKNFETFDMAMNDCLCSLSGLCGYWHNTLPSRMYEMAMSTLIQVLCQCVIKRVFEGQSISEPVAFMLEQHLNNMHASVSSYFLVPNGNFASKISAWVKFGKLRVLMRAQLQQLVELWYQDKEVKEHFTCEEVRHIIRMRFPDTQYRLKILQEIQ